MFKITGNKGFHMRFDNGCTVSVQFGAGNYGDNYDMSFDEENDGVPPSRRAEFAAWNGKGDFMNIEEQDIHGYIDANEALRLINIVATKEPTA